MASIVTGRSGLGTLRDVERYVLLLEMSYEHGTIRIKNVDSLAVSGTRKVHVSNYVSRQADLLDLHHPLVDVWNGWLHKVRIRTNYLVQLGKGSEVDVVRARLGMPRSR